MKLLLAVLLTVTVSTQSFGYTLNDMGQGTSPYYPQNKVNNTYSRPYTPSNRSLLQQNNGSGYGSYSGSRQYNYNQPDVKRFNQPYNPYRSR